MERGRRRKEGEGIDCWKNSSFLCLSLSSSSKSLFPFHCCFQANSKVHCPLFLWFCENSQRKRLQEQQWKPSANSSKHPSPRFRKIFQPFCLPFSNGILSLKPKRRIFSPTLPPCALWKSGRVLSTLRHYLGSAIATCSLPSRSLLLCRGCCSHCLCSSWEGLSCFSLSLVSFLFSSLLPLSCHLFVSWFHSLFRSPPFLYNWIAWKSHWIGMCCMHFLTEPNSQNAKVSCLRKLFPSENNLKEEKRRRKKGDKNRKLGRKVEAGSLNTIQSFHIWSWFAQELVLFCLHTRKFDNSFKIKKVVVLFVWRKKRRNLFQKNK